MPCLGDSSASSNPASFIYFSRLYGCVQLRKNPAQAELGRGTLQSKRRRSSGQPVREWDVCKTMIGIMTRVYF